jgi:hypothetical protein
MEPWTHETLTQLRGATHRGDSSLALELLRSHPVLDAAHTISQWLIRSIEADVPGARWLGMSIVDALRTSELPGDVALATRLQHALDGREPPDLALIPIDLFMLSDILDGGDRDTMGYRLNAHTGQILSEDPEGYEGVPEPPDWDDDEVWLYLEAIWPAHGWQDMADYIATVEDPALAERLNHAIRGKGAFRRFGDITYDTEHESRFVLFRDERETGRARHWLAERGLRPD